MLFAPPPRSIACTAPPAASVLRSKTAAAILEQRRRIENFNRLTLAVVLSLGALISVVALVCLVLQRRGAHAEYRLQRVALDCSARSELSDQSKALCERASPDASCSGAGLHGGPAARS